MRKPLLAGAGFLLCLSLTAQTGWRTLPNAGSPLVSRIDDVFFINDSTGWTVSADGRIHMTSNGGDTWTEQAFFTGKFLRSIEFTTPLKGFCGSVDSALYRTLDGGKTWTDITHLIAITPKIPGVCGISAPDSMTIYVTGTWFARDNVFIAKSTDGGNTWNYSNMNSHASGLVDILFINKDIGWVSGSGPVSEGRRGVILYTENGGQSWQRVYEGSPNAELVWKLQTPDNKIFFASIQAAPGRSIRIAKSTDEGRSWFTKIVTPTHQTMQAIGFMNPTLGWTGGADKLYKTTDGGETWVEENGVGANFNRFFRVNNRLAYLSGQHIYKYNAQQDQQFINQFEVDDVHSLRIVPNPSHGKIRIEAVFRNPTMAHLYIFDSKGSQIAVLFSGRINTDSRTFEYNLPAPGLYYVRLHTHEGIITQKVIRQ